MATARRKHATETHPFLFLGAGLGTSRKCLECQICFARAPSSDERAAIERLLPPALTYVKTWTSAVLNFGSDDTLEYLVASNKKKPTRTDWGAFCEDVERRALEVHGVCPIALFVKDDDGTYGRKLGAWHRWSVRELATRFHELPLPPEGGAELVAVASSVLAFVAGSPRASAAIKPAARSRLVDWSAKLVPHAHRHAGPDLVDTLLSLMPEDEPLSPERASALLFHPTKALIQRLGHDEVTRRAVALMSSATPETADDVLETLLTWMVDDSVARSLGEALLAAESMKGAVEERSARVRAGFAADKPIGESCPSLALFAHAAPLLDMKEPARALACIELGLRFPPPTLRLHGLRVRALHRLGRESEAEELAKSDVVQNEAGLEDPGVFYEVARYYVDRGRLDDALGQLRRYVEHAPRVVPLLGYDPRLRALHGLPGFSALLGGHPFGDLGDLVRRSSTTTS
jgi:hypothetical protein